MMTKKPLRIAAMLVLGAGLAGCAGMTENQRATATGAGIGALGGAAIGGDPSTGVVDQWHRVFGHPGISITDGSTISANLGVNPSLTITAQAERAMALWPRKGSRDPRPAPPTLDP